MYEVIGNTQSRAFRVLWMLEELGQSYEHSPEKPHSEMVSSLNPSGKIPILKDDGEVLTDSTAIITYLADKHKALTHPCGTVARARQDGLLHQFLDELDAVLWVATRHGFTLPEERRVPAVKESLRWEFEGNIRRIAQRFEGPFVMGEEMTVPDIVLTHCLNWAYAAKFAHGHENLLEYARRMRARDAFRRALGS